MRTTTAPDTNGSAMPANRPAPARVVTVTTGTVHAVSAADASRTVCGRPIGGHVRPVPADRSARLSVCVSTCRTCDARTGGTMPAASAAPSVSPTRTAMRSAMVRPVRSTNPAAVTVDGDDTYPCAFRIGHAGPCMPGTRQRTTGVAYPPCPGDGTADAPADADGAWIAGASVEPVRHDDTGDTMVTWHGCIVGARFTHRADAHVFVRSARTMADRPAACPLPSGGYGACVRQRDHGGRCASAHGERYTFPASGPAYPRPSVPVRTSAPGPYTVVTWVHRDGCRPYPRPAYTVPAPAATLPARPDRIVMHDDADPFADVDTTSPDRIVTVHIPDVGIVRVPAYRADDVRTIGTRARVARDRIGGPDAAHMCDVVVRTIADDTDTLRTRYRPAVPAPLPVR